MQALGRLCRVALARFGITSLPFCPHHGKNELCRAGPGPVSNFPHTTFFHYHRPLPTFCLLPSLVAIIPTYTRFIPYFSCRSLDLHHHPSLSIAFDATPCSPSKPPTNTTDSLPLLGSRIIHSISSIRDNRSQLGLSELGRFQD